MNKRVMLGVLMKTQMTILVALSQPHPAVNNLIVSAEAHYSDPPQNGNLNKWDHWLKKKGLGILDSLSHTCMFL